MANTDYIRDRTNQILRERIAMGVTQGGGRSTKKCATNEHGRRAYVRKDGTRVKAACVKNRAAPKRRVVVKRKVVAKKRVVAAKKCAKNEFPRRGFTFKKGPRKGVHVKATCVKRRGGEEMDFLYGQGDMNYNSNMNYDDDTNYGDNMNYGNDMNNGLVGGVHRTRQRKPSGTGKINPWIWYVKEVAAKNNISYCEAIQAAKQNYHEVKPRIVNLIAREYGRGRVS